MPGIQLPAAGRRCPAPARAPPVLPAAPWQCRRHPPHPSCRPDSRPRLQAGVERVVAAGRRGAHLGCPLQRCTAAAAALLPQNRSCTGAPNTRREPAHPASPLWVLSRLLRWLSTTCTSPLAGSSNNGTSTAAYLLDTWAAQQGVGVGGGGGGGRGGDKCRGGGPATGTHPAHRRTGHPTQTSPCHEPKHAGHCWRRPAGDLPARRCRTRQPTGGATGVLLQDACRFESTRSRPTMSLSAAAARRVCTISAGVVAPATASLGRSCGSAAPLAPAAATATALGRAETPLEI